MNNDRPVLDLTASCPCGAVALSVRGPVLSMLACACLDCQRANGGGHTNIAVFPATTVSLAGAVNAFDRPSDSGAIFTRHFCPQCGAGLYGQSSRSPQLTMVLVGLFAGQNDWFAPTQLIFARTLPAWDIVADHLPRHDTYRQAAT